MKKIFTKDLILVMTGGFFYMMCPMMTTPLVAGYAQSLGSQGIAMGLIAGAMNMCSLVMRPFAGNMADIFSKYRLAFAGGIIMCIACLGYMHGSVQALLVSRIIHGIGFSLCSVAMATWFSGMLPKEKMGSGIGLYGTMNALSMAIAPVIGIQIQQHFGYRASFAAAVTVTVILMIIIQFVGDRGETEVPVEERMERMKKVSVVDKNAAPVVPVIMMFAIPYFAIQTFIVSYIGERGLDADASLFFPVYSAVLLVMRIGMGPLFDRKPFGFFMWFCSACSFTGIMSLTFMKGNGLLLLAAVAMAGGYGVMCSVAQSTAIILAGPEKRGLANSTYYIGLDMGMVGGPVIGGLLYDHVKPEMFYPVFLFTIVIAMAVYFISLRNVNREKDI